jgi:putative flippase GtrA
MQANIAFSIGYMTSLTIAYVLNTIFIFHKKFGFFDYIKFTISYIPNFLIQSGVVFIVFNILGWYKLIAYILAAMIGIPVTYVILNVFAFKKDEQKPIAK